MRQSWNQIEIKGTVDQVMALAFDLPRWPEFLPHYRWVKVLKDDGIPQTIEMACWRRFIPLKWRSQLWVRPKEHRMRFLHVAGPARGMNVEWTVKQHGENVQVAIRHDMSMDLPVINSAAGRWVVSEMFVSPIAHRTLWHLKQAVESGVR